jgi:beta-galactosidase
MELHLKEDFENINYFGLGEIETYVDRNKAAKFGNYSLTVTENYVPYIRPQENSSHFRTRRVTLSNESGNSVTATGYGIPDFSFNASHFSAEQLTEKKHHFELEKEPYTILNLDGRFTAHSENPEFNNDENNRIIDEKEFKFGFMFEVK